MITPKQTIVGGIIAGVALWTAGYIMNKYGDAILMLMGGG